MPPTASELTYLQQHLAADLRAFAPEVVISSTILALLIVRMFLGGRKLHLGAVALGGSLAALLALVGPYLSAWPATPPSLAFTGLLSLDGFAEYLRILLLVFAVLAVVLTRLTGIPDSEDAADFYTLLLGGTLGLLVMVSANHLLMVFLGLEMASLPSYALSGFLKGKKQGSEAALKYVLYGAASSGVALYGISLLTAFAGTGHLPTLAQQFSANLSAGVFPPVLATGLLFLLVGFGFKIGVVPFHFWVPDVFDGAAAEVGAFLSVASKAAAIGLTARVVLTLSGPNHQLDSTVGMALIVVSGLTATFGNLVALAQTNLKRLLAYSTIAHAGYMLMGLAVLNKSGAAAVLFYLAAYLLMNLGAFATVAVIRNRTGGESVADCKGLMVRSPAVGIGLAVFLLSLLGLPPLAGFAGKFQVFAAVFEAGQATDNPNLRIAFYALLGVGVVNTVISAGYYLKLLRTIGLDEPVQRDDKGDPIPLGESAGLAAFLGFLAIALVILGVWWGPLTNWSHLAVAGLR